MEKENLMKIGLTEGEAKVYLALLDTGTSTVGSVVKKSGVAYSNVYEILERLIKKGLVSFVIRSKTKYFQAAEPERFYDYIERKERDVRKEKGIVERLVPQLSEICKLKGEKLEAEVFVGTEGAKTAFEKILSGYRKGDDYVFFYDPGKEFQDRFDRFFLNFDKRVYLKRGVSMRGVGQKYYYMNSLYIKKSKMVKRGSMKIRYVEFPVPGNIDVYKDRIMLSSWSEPKIAVLIHSREIAEKFMEYFESVWKISKK